MTVTIHPSAIKGTIQVPASKSSMQRICAAALLHKGKTIVHNPGISHDDKAALQVITQLGAILEWKDDVVHITGNGVHPVSDKLNCGESGLGIRMFAPIAALSNRSITINGEGSLLSRPMDFFDHIFPQLDIETKTNKGKLPLQIKGPLQPNEITVNGSLSSQFLTGLLFAYAAAVQSPVNIHVTNLASKPYIDLSLKVLTDFGFNIQNDSYQTFTVYPASYTSERVIEYTVEGDWSGAAFLLVAGAIAGSVTTKGLDINSTQADKAILEALKDCGANLVFDVNEITCSKGELKAFKFDATHCPDLFPPLVALAAYCKGDTIIDGVERLIHKESNRAITLQEEFGKMDVAITLHNNQMIINGNNHPKGAVVDSHNDHRIAMACAIAALQAQGATTIEQAAAINKSYPDFYKHLEQISVL